MYIYDEEKELFTFDGDFDEFLIELGVSKEHINCMKDKKLYNDKLEYYDDYEETQYETLVPLEKVIWTSRANYGWSVYENVRRMHIGDREPTRFQMCFLHRKDKNFREYCESFEKDIKPVDLVHFVEDDEYCVSSDGNHRTLTAMLIGAKNIKAKVYDCHIDYIKKDRYEISKAFYKKYNIEKIVEQYGNISYTIYFQDEKGVFTVTGYPEYYVSSSLESYLTELGNIIEDDFKKANFIQRFPGFMQNIMLFFMKNRRIRQIINKRYYNKEQTNFRTIIRTVHLYDDRYIE